MQIKVWDLPTRLFHWSLALSFGAAYLSSRSDQWLIWHMGLGYLMFALVMFRVYWGMVGSRWARFSSFKPSILAAYRYAKHALSKEELAHPVGHNPLGAWAIYTLLILVMVIVGSGFAYWQYDILLGETIHVWASNLSLVVVFLHLCGVVVSSIKQRENLITAMITGNKQGEAHHAISYTHAVWAFFLILIILTFLWVIAYKPSYLGLVV
ncbi:cytochrome b/b6 domain-containing protein [Agitococcus lubricus]|uniref:Cytochrome b n=1 Tax=Agitococcus lubricus TaxID=1077255 RepID=A0A2T5J3U6_9GAMM|nr:cytochrome b/b6 domain-containing protein [Agitococcus lubricus]PTQ91289.1 cytochrome b [Agitococcus lubricus]